MTRAGTGSQASPGAVSAPASRADTCIRAAAGVTVAGLAGIAGAISYSHMQELAAAHGETGWQAHAFPLSVDGIEVVASLVLLADRRLGRRPGWLPWAALAAGTTASLAANVAAAGAGPVGRVIAGWPAFALLVAVKLLSGMLEHRHGADRLAGTQDRPVPVQDRPPAADVGGDDHGIAGSRVRDPPMTGAGGDGGTGRLAGAGTVPHLVTSNGLALDPGTGTGTGTGRPPGRGTEPGDGPRTITAAVAGTAAHAGTGADPETGTLLPAARAARDRVLGRGDSLTRDSLAAELRRDGHPVRNARISQLLTALKLESCEAPGAQATEEPPPVGAGRLTVDSLR